MTSKLLVARYLREARRVVRKIEKLEARLARQQRKPVPAAERQA